MKFVALVCGVLVSTSVVAANVDTRSSVSDSEASPSFLGSCEFTGVYSSGCIDFVGANWTDGTMVSYCQQQEQPGETAVVQRDACKREDYNSLCANQQASGETANIYVNDLPAFICKKYLNGTLTKRPASGW